MNLNVFENLTLRIVGIRGVRGESMKGKSKKSTYSTTFGIDPTYAGLGRNALPRRKIRGVFKLSKCLDG